MAKSDKASKAKALTAKQELFCLEYIKDLNATQAAIRSGYSEKTAYKIGAENLSKPQIQERISVAQNERSERVQVDGDRVLQELAKIGFSDLRKLFTPAGHLLPPDQWPEDVSGAISSLKVITKPGEEDKDGNKTVEHVHEIKLWDKNSALEKIAKHLGMFIETVNLKHSGEVTQNHNMSWREMLRQRAPEE
ncbi:Terminase small subunit [Pseudovibrio sp. Ad5]|uniref:terminase small subunit n=1 Tax=unclassified Pseudovibrio TaxID=2627060 RepID=UPI00070C0EF0|nr:MULTISPECIES: terminase small subunit [unclassified Pseudovibrio]KZL02196.1 Terminase small subunit [Pseudovibrio sp. Ad5]